MKKCKLCGGNCVPTSSNTYQCEWCGNVFTEDDFVNKNTTKMNAPMQNEDIGATLFEKSINGVCEIATATGRGSGYLIHENGFVITNFHVVTDESKGIYRTVNVKIANEVVSAKVVSVATTNTEKFCSNEDLALLQLNKVPFHAKALKFGDHANVKTGETVFVIGNSLGQGTCMTKGIVSDRNRNGQILTDCPINPGNSGGPIFNARGEVIGTMVASGMRSSGSDAEGMNYAIPSNQVISFLRKHGIQI